MLQDRISHHECGDESFSGYGQDSAGRFIEYHYDGTECGQDAHAKGHWEEIGQTSLPLRTYMGLEYTFDELVKFATAICATKDANKTRWLESGRCTSDGKFAGPRVPRTEVVGRRTSASNYYNGADTFVEGSVTRALKPVGATARIMAVRDAVVAFGGTPLPGSDVTCP